MEPTTSREQPTTSMKQLNTALNNYPLAQSNLPQAFKKGRRDDPLSVQVQRQCPGAEGSQMPEDARAGVCSLKILWNIYQMFKKAQERNKFNNICLLPVADEEWIKIRDHSFRQSRTKRSWRTLLIQVNALCIKRPWHLQVLYL